MSASSLFVYKCIKCRKALGSYGVLCDDCLLKLRKETMLPCSKCGVQHNSCACKIQRDRSGIVYGCAHVAPYLKSGVAHKIICTAKVARSDALFDFMAQALADRVRRAFIRADIIVNIPRSFLRRRKYGFDQTKEVAKRLAELLDIEYADALKHRGFLSQKKLGLFMREKNASSSFSVNKEFSDILNNKRVILYDDLTTSGATARACVKLLKEAGVSCVYFLSFAKTEKQK